MAILRKAVSLTKETKRHVFLQELKNKGILQSRDGKALDDLSYYELRNELAMHEILGGESK